MKTIPDSHLDIFEAKPFANVATLRPDGLMSVHPVSVIYRDGNVCFSTLKSRKKYSNLLKDNRVSICIPHPENPMHYVEVRGRATIEDDINREFINDIAKQYMGQDEYPFDKPADERVTITIHAEQISASARG